MATLKAPLTPSDHVRGASDAPVTLVEYGDYECPHCALAHPIVRLIEQQFGPNIRFVFRHFPLKEIHPHAEAAAESAEFASAHDRFWEMHDGLYENQDRLGSALFMALVRALGLSEAELQGALINRAFAPTVRSDFLGGVRSGVNGTPTFFINGQRHDGSYEFEELAGSIDIHLRAKALL
jgi:protein-disulfide isomerase